MSNLEVRWIEPHPRLCSDLRAHCLTQPFLAITGAPGSGKSRVLKELRRSIEQTGDVIFVRPPLAPRIDNWRALSLRRPDLQHSTKLWRVLILCSVATHVRRHVDLLGPSEQRALQSAFTEFPRGLVEQEYPTHPFAVVRALAQDGRLHSDPSKMKFLDSPIWDTLEQVLTACITPTLPTILIEIDELDGYFELEPALMTEIQSGLAKVLVDLADSGIGNGKLRIHATVRHIADRFVALNTSRPLRGAAVVEIRWSKSAIRKVLMETLQARNASVLVTRIRDGRPIQVSQRGCDESLPEYLLRHTTLAPRDAESLADALASRQNGRSQPLGSSEIRRAVAEHSERLASSMLAQVVSDMRALTGRPPDRRTTSTASDGRQRTLTEALGREIERLGSDSISWHELQELVQSWDEATRPFLQETLWSYRVVGHRLARRHEMRISARIGDRLGRGHADLLLHPVLLDLLYLEPVKEEIHIDFA